MSSTAASWVVAVVFWFLVFICILCILAPGIYVLYYFISRRFRLAKVAPDVDAECYGSTTSDDTVLYKSADNTPIKLSILDTLPKYWSNTQRKEGTSFASMVYAKRDLHGYFERLLSHTYRERATQDRPCPRECPRTCGGCPCVQPGGDPGLPMRYCVRRVIRVEKSDAWDRYIARKRVIEERRWEEGSCDQFDPLVQTTEVVNERPDIFAPLEKDINEVYLWHGTHVRSALAIASGDFRIDFAGSSNGTMYGLGVYLSENSTKADEYASDDPAGHYNGVYALVLCRAVLGKYFYTTQRDVSAGDMVRSEAFDSTCGDRAKSANTFREFVVYDEDQLYPEYVILYSRLHRGDDPRSVYMMISSPFRTEFPVYWTNCHMNPHVDQFNMQYHLAQSTFTLLQRLGEATLETSCANVTVVSARRVENSTIWNRYAARRDSLRSKMVYYKRSCSPPEQLTGDKVGGRVLTSVHLAADSAEEVISSENLDDGLCEYMLWHGSSKEAVEAIAHADFRDPKLGNVTHGTRFGAGIYLAESLSKSSTYATEDPTDETQYLLLCRVLCGDMYYSENWFEENATDTARALGKDCVLANPNRLGNREFIVLETDQVYPEYVLQIRTGNA